MAIGSDTTFAQRAGQLRAEIDAALDAYVDFSDDCPSVLADAMRYSLLAPGKRLRPIIVLLAAESCGSTRQEAMPAACAVEMIHAYSLVHDDLPAMDDDDLRRGRPTCHKQFDEATAVLVGDALQARAFELIASHTRPAETAAACCAALARAAGAEGMVGGQVDDLAQERNAKEDNKELSNSSNTDRAGAASILQSIHRRKTGAMFNVALRIGGLVAAARPEAMEALRIYGEHLGLAFQIVDDLLDVAGEESNTGKRVGKDVQRGKLTYPGLLGVDESRRRAQEMIDQACAALAPLGTAASSLEALARFVVERDR